MAHVWPLVHLAPKKRLTGSTQKIKSTRLNKPRQTGFTFTEQIISLSIASILFGLSAPSLKNLWNQQQRSASVNAVIGALNYTQQEAVFGGVNTVICPSSNRIECDRRWGANKLLVYQDRDSNNAFDSNIDETLKVISLDEDWSIKWRAFGNRKYIAYQPTGYIFNQNGTMEICPKNATDSIAILVVNRIGRLRRSERDYEDSRCST